MDILGLLPQFGGLIWTLVAFVIALSVIVAIHEYGHYIVGRWCGIKADVFSLGFGPVLWAREDKHGTKWQIGYTINRCLDYWLKSLYKRVIGLFRSSVNFLRGANFFAKNDDFLTMIVKNILD